MEYQQLADHAISKLESSGFGMLPANREPGLLMHAPFSLFPRHIPADLYANALELAPLFNMLVDRISRNPTWLMNSLKSTCEADEFTNNLMKIYEQVVKDGIKQQYAMGIHRSDYMIDEGIEGTAAKRLRQIELNTISSGFTGLSTVLNIAHHYLYERYMLNEFNTLASSYYGTDDMSSLEIPHNDSLEKTASVMKAGFDTYGVPEAYVAFVVQPNERNIMDQRTIEHKMWEKFKLRSIRLTLRDIYEDCVVDSASGKLIYHSKQLNKDIEFAIVYYRSGYGPNDHPSELEWKARLIVEQSLAIKCPPIGYQLAGTKKVQQILAVEGQLELFLSSEDAMKVRSCFAHLWSLDHDDIQKSKDIQRAISDAKIHPENYVIKPQREGGGNNSYGHAIAIALGAEADASSSSKHHRMSDSELSAHILMERIYPKERSGVLVRLGKAEIAHSVCELGIYSVFLGNGSDVPPVVNSPAGYLLRTKVEGTDEGGVAAGFSVLDSPCWFRS
jgi:glutathione synthase